jgi:hypothetical protein
VPWRTVGVVLGVLRGIGSPYFAGNNEYWKVTLFAASIAVNDAMSALRLAIASLIRCGVPWCCSTAVASCGVSANRLHGFGRFMLQNIGHARQAIVITCRPTANEARMEASGFTRLRNSRAGDVRWKPSGRGVVAPLPACAGDTRGVAVVGACPG